MKKEETLSQPSHFSQHYRLLRVPETAQVKAIIRSKVQPL